MSELTFAALGLAEPLLRAVADTGYTTPTPIQAQAIPQVLLGGDLLAAAQTGTGKTAGFTLPLLHRLMDAPAKQKGRPRALVLTPTRELAAQVEESVREYGKYLPLKSMVMFGGVGINPQIAALRKPVDILVATPGRLLDHAGQKTVDLSGVEILVLDEADRMLDMGFIHDIKKVLALLPAATPEPAVLGHILERDQDPGRQAAEPAQAGRSSAPEPDQRPDHPEGAPGRPRPQNRAADQHDQRR